MLWIDIFRRCLFSPELLEAARLSFLLIEALIFSFCSLTDGSWSVVPSYAFDPWELSCYGFVSVTKWLASCSCVLAKS